MRSEGRAGVPARVVTSQVCQCRYIWNMSSSEKVSTAPAYSYLGPAGTFTEAALSQVPEAAGKTWHSVNNVGEALADVVSGRSVAAMIAIENSVEGGVTA